MKRKILDKIAIGIFLLLIAGSLIVTLVISSNSKNIKQEDALAWYRSKDLPEDCRLPEYENDLEEWKKNLRHDKETWYCLKYYE